jgi:4-hydroxy-tetrahydrodipicolinate synthase
MFAAFEKGDVARAREINATLIESFDFFSGPEWPSPIPTKAMLRTLGLPAGECRLPIGSGPAELEDRAREIYARLVGG